MTLSPRLCIHHLSQDDGAATIVIQVIDAGRMVWSRRLSGRVTRDYYVKVPPGKIRILAAMDVTLVTDHATA